MSEQKDFGMLRRNSGRSPEHHLRTITKNVIPPVCALDIVHVTPVGNAREIIKAGQIETQTCSVFNKRLVYFFLARPVYRLRKGDQKSEAIGRFPFVFVASTDYMESPSHVYPFDTGAAIDGRYDEKLAEGDYLEDFELEPSHDAASRHVKWAFGSNEAYFDGSLRLGLSEEVDDWATVAKGYVRIAGLAASGHNQPDQRTAAIELAYSKHVRLKGNVRFAVIPLQFLENPKSGNKNHSFIDELNRYEIKWATYDWRPNETPNYYLDEVTRIIRQYLMSKGQL